MSDALEYIAPPGSIPTLEVPALDGIGAVHMIGIGGAGMSGIALLLLARGFDVTGSDLKESRVLDDLRAAGATIAIGHAVENVGTSDAVVISSAIPERNPELVAARSAGTPVYARAQMLAALGRGARTVAIAGTHGKTTTTSMLAVILDRLGVDPTFVIGGDLNESGSNAHHGSGDAFVIEADESDGSFLLLAGEIGVITNVEADHLDFFGDEGQVRAAFAAFAQTSAVVIANGDDPGTRAALVAASLDASHAVLTFGIGESVDAQLDVLQPGQWEARGSLAIEGHAPVDLRLRVPGVHNLLNACAAVLAARALGMTPHAAAEALSTFTGVRRRFEYRGAAKGAEFFDDYAHHPTEIAAALAAACQRKGHDRVIAVFQPHRYTRTQALWRELGASLAGADVVAVTDIYPAGELPIPGVYAKLLVEALIDDGFLGRVLYLPRRSDVVRFLAHTVRQDDLVLTIGAGDVTAIPDEAIERILA